MTVAADALPRVPFTAIDEGLHLTDTPAEPWSIQLELRVARRLDDVRLRTAIADAASHHEMARARMLPARRTDRHHQWEITADLDLDPLRVVDCLTEDAIAATRAELHSISVPLVESPPFRARLVHHPKGDLVMLNVNHAAFDGYGCVNLLRSIARAYAGRPDPRPDIDLADARDLRAHLMAEDATTRFRRLRTLAEKARDLATPPSRLATEGGNDRAGYGFHLTSLPEDVTEAISGLPHEATVNDVLVTTLHLAIDQWNRTHDTPTGRISVLVPVNLRPKEWAHEVASNFVLQSRVTTDAADRQTARAALDEVTAQSRRIKEHGTGAALIEFLQASSSLPLWAKAPLAPALWLTGNRLIDTAVLSNLGPIDDPLGFGREGGKIRELWFSVPARMPGGLSIGVVTEVNRVHLAFRYRHPLFGEDAAAKYAEIFRGQLEQVMDAAG